MDKKIKAFFVCLQSGVVPYGCGEPGISKTRTTEAFARVVNRQYECVIGSQRLPEDICGAPKVSARRGSNGQSVEVMSHVKPEWRFNLEDAPTGGVLHLDELGDCQPAMQAAMLQILGDGIPNTWIGATGNPIEISTHGFELSLPAINRLCQIEWPVDKARWEKGMLHGWESLDGDFPILPQDWKRHLVESRALIVSYISRNARDFQQMPTDPHQEIKPWASQRSWTSAGTVLAACRSLGSSEDLEDILLAGCVGSAAALGFRSYLNTLDLPHPEELLAHPEKYKPNARGDLTMAILSSVVSAVLGNNTPERWGAAWKIMELQADKAADAAVAVCGGLVQNRPVVGGKQLAIPKQINDLLFPLLQEHKA